MICALKGRYPIVRPLAWIVRRAAPLARAVLLAACTVHAALAGAADTPGAGAGRSRPVATGESAPDFTLLDSERRAHALSAQRGRRAVVLVFYRGFW